MRVPKLVGAIENQHDIILLESLVGSLQGFVSNPVKAPAAKGLLSLPAVMSVAL